MSPKLSPTIKTLCAKVGLEQTRPAQWLISRQLRSEALAMVIAGQSESDVLGWLGGLMADAMQSQSKA